MLDSLSSPITETLEVEALLDELPIAVERGHFIDFVRGFPRKYLVTTPRVEIVKHYFLMEGLKEKGHDMVIAYVQTSREEVHNEFYLTHREEKLTEEMQKKLREKLACLGNENQILKERKEKIGA